MEQPEGWHLTCCFASQGIREGFSTEAGIPFGGKHQPGTPILAGSVSG